MTAREEAIKLMKAEAASHIIYGYRAKGKTVEGSWPNEMLRFWDDEAFVRYIDKMQSEIDGFEMILAVHRR